MVRLSSSVFLLAALWCSAALSHAGPTLHCEMTYAGATQTLNVTPVDDPYPVPSVDVGWALPLQGSDGGARYPARLHQDLRFIWKHERSPCWLQQASYYPPFTPSPKGQRLTGKQFVYAGPVERELQYECVLQGVKP